MAYFDSLTNLYSLTKTLRFELKPIGKTLDKMREHLQWDEKLQTFLADQNIEDAYQVLKPVFDKLHEDFITKSLESNEAKKISFIEYFYVYKEWDELKRKKTNDGDKKRREEISKQIDQIHKEGKTKGKIQKLEDDLRKSFENTFEKYGEIFKEEAHGILVEDNEENEEENLSDVKDDKKKGFRKLLKAKFLLDYIEKYIDTGDLFDNIKSKDGERLTIKQIKDSLSKFKGLSSYFGGFELNRLNYYVTKKDATTAVASRIVDENLPKFCDNALNFIKHKDVYETVLQFLEEENIRIFDRNDNKLYKIEAELFDIAYFTNCLSQKEIEDYNKKIGNANYIINLYNQHHVTKDKKLSSFKVLYKQIGCGEKGEFIPAIKNNYELQKILVNVVTKGEKFFDAILDTKNGLISSILTLDSFGGIYWSDKALNTISSKYFTNWESLKELLKNAKIFKKEKDEIKIPQTIELSDFFTILDQENAPFKETFKDNNEVKQKIIGGSDKNSIKLLKMIVVDIEVNKKMFDQYKNWIVSAYSPNNGFYKKDENTQKIKIFFDAILYSNQILKYFKAKRIENKSPNTEIYDFLDKILDTENKGLNNPTYEYDLVRNYLTQKPAAELNKLKLNFENASLASGWDKNKEKDNSCVILKDKEDRQYLVVMKYKNTEIFQKNVQNPIYKIDDFGWEKMVYKLIPGASKTLPKVFFSKKWTDKYPTFIEISRIKKGETFKKGDNFNKDDLHKLIDFYKINLKKYPSEEASWNNLFKFNFSETNMYESIDQFYNEVDKQGYKLDFVPINKAKLEEFVEKGQIYLFEIRNNDSDYYIDKNSKERKKKTILKKQKNLHTIYWHAIFDNVKNKPKLNGGAEIFYRPAILIKKEDETDEEFEERLKEKLGKKKDKSGKEVLDHKRFAEEKFVFHCPITLNFEAKETKFKEIINTVLLKSENKDNICFLGIDRGEKHLAYYSVVNQKGMILDQGSLNLSFLDKNDKPRSIKAKRYFEEDKKENEEWKPRMVDCWNYNDLLEARASNRDLARKNWTTIGTIKELKQGYISHVVHKISDLAVQYNAFIVLEDLNTGFKRGRQKIEKSVYQKLELALAKKLNFLVDKSVKNDEIGSVTKALQLTPQVTNFSDIEKAGSQFGIMLYVRANYTSQTDPITGWRKTIRFISSKNEDLKKEICEKFSEISFDGKDYYFVCKKDEKTIKAWRLWSGNDGKELERFRWNNQTRQIEQQHIIEILEKVFGKQVNVIKDLKNKITENNVKDLKFAIDLIQQIRNTGINEKDKDFILSPIRDGDGIGGNHFDSRESHAMISNGDANGAYNIARKGIMAFERIKDNPSKPNLYIADVDWDNFAQNVPSVLK